MLCSVYAHGSYGKPVDELMHRLLDLESWGRGYVIISAYRAVASPGMGLRHGQLTPRRALPQAMMQPPKVSWSTMPRAHSVVVAQSIPPPSAPIGGAELRYLYLSTLRVFTAYAHTART